MATNVTEKDKTLNEIIDWAKSRCHEAALSRFDVRRKSDRDFYDGQVNAFHEILELCRSMLDYIGFKPFTPGYVLEPSSVELGTFSCYEIKSCMADFKSGHGLTFYGDENYLVTTPVRRVLWRQAE